MDETRYFYLNGEILPEDKIKLSPFDRGFLFADGVYETIRWDYGKLFKDDLHIKRLKRNLNELKINIDSIPDIKKITSDLISRNNISADHILIYIQVTRGGSYPRQHYFPDPDVKPTVFIYVSSFERNLNAFNNGIKVILENDTRWGRCDIKSVSLLPNILARQKAVEFGSSEAIFVRDEMITEGSHTNFCGIKNGKLYTAPLSNYILPGITREIVLEICREFGIPIIEEYISKSDINNYDEFMVLGTISEVTPVIQINDFKIHNGSPREITIKLQKKLIKLMFG